MVISHLLEDFTQLSQTAECRFLSDDALEDTRLAAFEKGYQAGWDDASAAHSGEQSHISSELARNLQDLSFTYQEAFMHVTTALEPLLTRIVEVVLPGAAHHSLGARIVSEAMEFTKAQSQAQLILTLSSESRQRLEPLFQSSLPMPVTLVEDNALGSGQIFLKLGQEERSIDLDSLVKDIQASVSEFFTDNKR